MTGIRMSQTLFFSTATATCLLPVFCYCLITAERQIYTTYLGRKRKRRRKGRQFPPSLSLHPCSLFPSVIVISERLDWRQWQKREVELEVGDVLPLLYSLPLSVFFLLISLILHLLFFDSCPEVFLEGSPTPITSNLFWLFWSLFFICLSLHLSNSLFDSISGLSFSSTASLSPSLSLVFRQWNICSLNILPHYLSV